MTIFGEQTLADTVNSDPGRFPWLFGLAPYPYPPIPIDPAPGAPQTDPAAPPAAGQGQPAEAPGAEQEPSPCPGHPTADGGLAIPLACAVRGHVDEAPAAETGDVQAAAESTPEAGMLP